MKAIWSWVTGSHRFSPAILSFPMIIIARSAVPRRLLWEGWKSLRPFSTLSTVRRRSLVGRVGKSTVLFHAFHMKSGRVIPAAYVLQNLRHFHLCLTALFSMVGNCSDANIIQLAPPVFFNAATLNDLLKIPVYHPILDQRSNHFPDRWL